VSRKIVAAILAAGASSRFGSPKQLAKLHDKTLLDISLDNLIDAHVDKIGVVIGSNFDQVNAHLENRKTLIAGDFATLNNAKWEHGLSSSIRTATEFAITNDATHLLLVACDQPFVTAKLIRRLCEYGIEEVQPRANSERIPSTSPSTIVACRYGGSVGIPALFPALYFEKMRALTGDKGAKSIILECQDSSFIDFDQAAVDIDTTNDLSSATTL
jgi:molybdenum cofactor cytidylyltransferase